jgi:retron-type reverse transcriptase
MSFMRRRLLRSQLRLKNLERLSDNTIHYYCATGIDNMNYPSFRNQKIEIYEKIRKDVLCGDYNFVRYKEKLIIKNRNSNPRCISIPTLRDRLTNKVILETLKEYYPECSRTHLPQECIKLLDKYLTIFKYEYFIKLDLSDFYGKINQPLLLKKLSLRIKDKNLLKLIKDAIQTPTIPEEKKVTEGVPQGLSISNILSQIYMLEFDELNFPDCHIVRYVDDILVLCKKSNANNIFSFLKEYIIDTLGLKLNTTKKDEGELVKKGFDYLGYHISLKKIGSPTLTIKKQNIYRLEKKIIDLITRYKYQQGEKGNFSTDAFIFELNLIISGTISSQIEGSSCVKKRYGWMFFYSQINDLNRLFHLDRFIEKNLKDVKLPESDLKRVKKFIKAYHEIRFNLEKSNYVFRPDNISLSSKKEMMREYYAIDIIKDEDVERIFRKMVYRKIKNNERDIIHDIS